MKRYTPDSKGEKRAKPFALRTKEARSAQSNKGLTREQTWTPLPRKEEKRVPQRGESETKMGRFRTPYRHEIYRSTPGHQGRGSTPRGVTEENPAVRIRGTFRRDGEIKGG